MKTGLSHLRRLLADWHAWLGLAAITLLVLVNLDLMKFYLLLDTNFYFALALGPFIIGVNRQRKGRLLYGFVAIVSMILWHQTGMQTFFYFSLVFSIVLLIDLYLGRVNSLVFFFVFLCSPLATYGFKVFGFPIRLQLTEWATSLLNSLGLTATSAGNTIQYLGEEFTVEPACTGLKMVIIGLLVSLVLIRKSEKDKKLDSPYWKTTLILAITFLCITVTNLFRIMALIIMQAPEESFSHEFIGLFALTVYCIIPMTWLIPKCFDDRGSKPPTASKKLHYLSHIMTVILLFTLTLAPRADESRVKLHSQLDSNFSVEGYSREQADFDGYKLKNENALLYVKPCFNFWRSDHNPIICWRGSGYHFLEERIVTIGNTEVYMAKLKKHDEILHTAWWYQNNQTSTVSQWEWRWDMAKGSDQFKLVNVTSASIEQLFSEVAFLTSKTL